MEFNFSPFRSIALAVLLGVFAMLGGFELLTNEAARMNRAVFYCIAFFVGGAVSATVVDHYVGTMERMNLRVVYVLGGVALMVGAVLWLFSIKQALAME